VPEQDDDATKLDKAEVDCQILLVSHRQPSEVAQPSNPTVGFPAPPPRQEAFAGCPTLSDCLLLLQLCHWVLVHLLLRWENEEPPLNRHYRLTRTVYSWRPVYYRAVRIGLATTLDVSMSQGFFLLCRIIHQLPRKIKTKAAILPGGWPGRRLPVAPSWHRLKHGAECLGQQVAGTLSTASAWWDMPGLSRGVRVGADVQWAVVIDIWLPVLC